MRVKKPGGCKRCLQAFGLTSRPPPEVPVTRETPSTTTSICSMREVELASRASLGAKATPLMADQQPLGPGIVSTSSMVLPLEAPGIDTEVEEELFQKALRFLEIATEKEMLRCADPEAMSVLEDGASVGGDLEEEVSDDENEDSKEECGDSSLTTRSGSENRDDCSNSNSNSNTSKEDSKEDSNSQASNEKRLEMHSLGPPVSAQETTAIAALRSQVLTECKRQPFLCDEDLTLMLNLLSRRQLPDSRDALRLAYQMREYLRTETEIVVNVPRPKKRLIIVGDLHGHLNDFLHLLHHHGEPHEENMYLFNGDFVDRGVWGPEVVLAVFCLKLLHKETVFLNRGNHESELCTRVYGFKSHLQCAFPDNHEELYIMLHEAFNELPLCHIVGDEVCVVHGGLTREPVCLDDIKKLKKGPVPEGNSPDDMLFQALLWSDPKEHPGRSDRGIGWHFSPKRTAKFLERSNLKVLVRSHECVDGGFQYAHRGKVVTVFSASNYDSANAANVAFIDSDCEVHMGEEWNEEYVKPNWVVPENAPGDVNALLRRASSAAWEDEDKRAIASLINRVGGSVRRLSAKERVLAKLQAKIFLARTILLDAFQLKDRLDNGSPADWFGTITPERWVETIHATLKTPAGFPWLELLPYLARRDAHGQVLYMDFVFRYHNKISRWLMDQLSTDWLAHIADDIEKSPSEIFDSLDVHRVGKLSFADLRPFFQNHALGGKEVDTKEKWRKRELHFLGLFRAFSSGPRELGAVTKSEFVLTLNRFRTITSKKCPSGHRLERGSKSLCGFGSQDYQCDVCGRSISSSEEWKYCDRCQFDLCRECGKKLDEEASQSGKQREAHERKTLDHWNKVERVLSLLCSSYVDLDSLFGAGEDNRRKDISKTDFISIARELLDGDDESVASFYEAVSRYLKEVRWTRASRRDSEISISEKDNSWAIADLKECLRISDSADSVLEASVSA